MKGSKFEMETKVQFTSKYVAGPNNFMHLRGRIYSEPVSIAINLSFEENYIDTELANRLQVANDGIKKAHGQKHSDEI